MRVKVLLFGPVASAAGARELWVEVEGASATAGAVLRALAGSHPAIAGAAKAGRLAVNQEFAGVDQVIGEGDEVALIASVSGG